MEEYIPLVTWEDLVSVERMMTAKPKDEGDEGIKELNLKDFATLLAEDNIDEVVSRVEMCGGLARIKQLRSHAKESIRRRSQNILMILTSRAMSRGDGSSRATWLRRNRT